MKPKLVFVSYYTPNYKEHAERLIASLERFGLEYDVQAVERMEWDHAVRAKPEFIRKMLSKHKEADAIVWVDADSWWNQSPDELFNLHCDIACRFMFWKRKCWTEIHAGIIYIARNDQGRGLVESWIHHTKNVPADCRCPEQESLYLALVGLAGKITLWNIPEHYCHCVRESEKWAVLCQWQQSRYEREPEKQRLLLKGKEKFHRHLWRADPRLHQKELLAQASKVRVAKLEKRAKAAKLAGRMTPKGKR